MRDSNSETPNEKDQTEANAPGEATRRDWRSVEAAHPETIPASPRVRRILGSSQPSAFARMYAQSNSTSDSWATPDWLFDELDELYGFTLDPCADHLNYKCTQYFTREDDGLAQSWDGERVWLNPPYGREIGKWMKKALEADALVVALVPARTDTAWWHDYVLGKANVEFLRGRLKFSDSTNSAPFPSAIVTYRPDHRGASTPLWSASSLRPLPGSAGPKGAST